MHFTRAAIAAAILATASSAAPAPAGTSTTQHSTTTLTTSYVPKGTGNSDDYKSTKTTDYHSSMSYTSNPSPTQTSSNGGGYGGNTDQDGKKYLELSKTQQLFLADTAVDRFTILNKDEDFIFNFDVPQQNAGKGGNLIAANRKTFPALVGTGSGMAVGTINGCGINTFHVHPRSAELQIVTEGRLVTEMAPENGVLELDPATGKMVRRVIKTTLTPYMMTPFYQGSVHTQYNPDCTPAKFVASFASEDFGAGQIAEELFAMDTDVLNTVLGNGEVIDGADIEKIRGIIPASIAKGVDECLARCGIKKRAL